MKQFFVSLFLLSALFFYGCSTSDKTSRSETSAAEGSADKNYPSWFKGTRVSSDSLIIRSSATTISGDSLDAAKTAEKEARMLLEKFIGDQLEDIRMDLNLQGDRSMADQSFIFSLRNANQKIEQEALADYISVQTEGSGYRGFSEVYINRTTIRSLLRESLSNYPDHWGKMQNASGFSLIASF